MDCFVLLSYSILSFFLAIAVILPSVSRTLDLNSKYYLFHFRSFLYNFTLELEPYFKRVKSRKKYTAVRNIDFISKRPCICLFFKVSAQFKYSVSPVH